MQKQTIKKKLQGTIERGNRLVPSNEDFPDYNEIVAKK